MSAHSGPNSATSGLVFSYDMSNTHKSWKGAPTTNLIDVAENLLDAKWTKEGGFGTVTSNYGIAPDGTPTSTRLQYSSGYFYRSSNTTPAITALTAGTTVTFSCWVKGSAQPGRGIGLWSYAVGRIVAASNQAINPSSWTRVSVTYTIAVGATSFAIMLAGAPSNIFQGVVEVWKPQLEVQGFETPFINGTRSNTQSILDLTNNNTITATNLTYASDGTFSFNGTNAYINAGNAISPSNISISVWVYRTSTSTNQGICRKNSAYAISLYNNTVQVAPGNNWVFYNTTATIEMNTWVNLVWTYNGTTMILYKNSTNIWSTPLSGTLPANTSLTRIGYDDNGWFWGGTIPNIQIYDRALTAAEVQQNFNATRGRFGI